MYAQIQDFRRTIKIDFWNRDEQDWNQFAIRSTVPAYQPPGGCDTEDNSCTEVNVAYI